MRIEEGTTLQNLPSYDKTVRQIVDETADSEGYGQVRKSSAVNADVLTGELFDARFETTQRGLKSRHAPMIALGGTISTVSGNSHPEASSNSSSDGRRPYHWYA
ncbi:hypothetical protein H2203_005011 [Taxawa tesnikishii (nom. ined.)]|nr:hypothetical protein H2203_005011 [Dothideales sp. JES 119]